MIKRTPNSLSRPRPSVYAKRKKRVTIEMNRARRETAKRRKR